MEWALAVVGLHPCSWRRNSIDNCRFDWCRDKGHANGATRPTAHYAQDFSKTRRKLRPTFGQPCGPYSSDEV